jgi:hypothetical protein
LVANGPQTAQAKCFEIIDAGVTESALSIKRDQPTSKQKRDQQKRGVRVTSERREHNPGQR